MKKSESDHEECIEKGLNLVYDKKEWFFVKTHESIEGWRIKSFMDEKVTKFQKLKLIDTKKYGRCYVIDSFIQTSEKDKHYFNELVVHQALALHRSAERIILIGGGGGDTTVEALKWKSIKHIDMIEIDEEVIKYAKSELLYMNNGCFDNPKVKVHIKDGWDFIKECKDDVYDVLITELPDVESEKSPCAKLFTKEFFTMCKRVLKKNGVMSLFAGVADEFYIDFLSTVQNTVKSVFKNVKITNSYIPVFGTSAGFICAWESDELAFKDIDKVIEEKVFGGSKSLKIFEEEWFKKCLIFPKAIKKIFENEKRINELNKVISVKF